MRSHIAKAQHNERFLDFIETNAGDDFFDWKITVAFYAALHYLKAYFMLHGITAGNSHKEIDSLIDPKKQNTKLFFPEEQYYNYQELYRNARNSRYTGLYSTQLQTLLLKAKCDESKKALLELKTFFKANGLKL